MDGRQVDCAIMNSSDVEHELRDGFTNQDPDSLDPESSQTRSECTKYEGDQSDCVMLMYLNTSQATINKEGLRTK